MDHFFGVDGKTRMTLLSVFNTVQRTRNWPEYRGSCFCLAGFLALVFQSLGARARVVSCHAIVESKEGRYALGMRGWTTGDNQLDGHVVCVVDEKLIVDFGTTNMRKYLVPDFPVAIAVVAGTAGDGAPGALFPTAVNLGKGMTICWYEDPNPAVDQAVVNHAEPSRILFDQYQHARLHSRKMRRQTSPA